MGVGVEVGVGSRVRQAFFSSVAQDLFLFPLSKIIEMEFGYCLTLAGFSKDLTKKGGTKVPTNCKDRAVIDVMTRAGGKQGSRQN